MSREAGPSARPASPPAPRSPWSSPTCGKMRPMLPAAKIGTEYFLFGGAALVSVLAFAALILVPAVGSYGRSWEKATAALLSLFVLAALLLLGIALGVLVVYFWPDISDFLPGIGP